MYNQSSIGCKIVEDYVQTPYKGFIKLNRTHGSL